MKYALIYNSVLDDDGWDNVDTIIFTKDGTLPDDYTELVREVLTKSGFFKPEQVDGIVKEGSYYINNCDDVDVEL